MSPDPKPDPKPPMLKLDAATVTALMVVALLLPLLLAGFFFQ